MPSASNRCLEYFSKFIDSSREPKSDITPRFTGPAQRPWMHRGAFAAQAPVQPLFS